LSENGFTCKELEQLHDTLQNEYKIEFINLSKYTKEKTERACLLIIRNFLHNADKLYDEQKN